LMGGGGCKSHESGSLPCGVEGVTSSQFADQSLSTVILQVKPTTCEAIPLKYLYLFDLTSSYRIETLIYCTSCYF
jgi:hypothetical protein